MPVKDRYPPAAYDPADPRRRVCVLVDGQLVSRRSYLEQRAAIEANGAIVLTRVLAHELGNNKRALKWVRAPLLMDPHVPPTLWGARKAVFNLDFLTF